MCQGESLKSYGMGKGHLVCVITMASYREVGRILLRSIVGLVLDGWGWCWGEDRKRV